ncbi:SsgA family sporulation/cell division regulator [Streptomyces sp. NPDC001732]
MEQSPSTIACSVTAHVSALEGPRLPLPAELHYGTSEPYAVRLTLRSSLGPPIIWTFSRELLIEGTRRPTGLGDVLAAPRNFRNSHSLRIILSNSTGTALIDLDTARVSDFLQQAFTLVPLGTESSHLDIDAAITELAERGHLP